MDFILVLFKVDGFGLIMVVVDRFFKYVMFIVVLIDCMVEEVEIF